MAHTSHWRGGGVPRSRLKESWRRGETTYGIWVTLESPSITEIAAVAGLDWVVIDAEHGSLDFKEIVEHLRATRNSRTTPLVRVPSIDPGTIKRVLDLGAAGILLPQIRSAREVAEAIGFAKYPPAGTRGIGAERATRWGMGIGSHTRTANAETLVIPMIEHVDAGRALDEILDLAFVDAVFFGPYDYAASAGEPGRRGSPAVEREIRAHHRSARARRIPTGWLASGIEEARARRRLGFQMIGIGVDTLMLIGSLERTLAGLGRPVPRRTWNA
jgi:2-dehydro-3-deoxyglucarate aldolase